jgi:hypothetical protein
MLREVSRSLPQFFKAHAKLDHDEFLSHHFQFINHYRGTMRLSVLQLIAASLNDTQANKFVNLAIVQAVNCRPLAVEALARC